MPYSGLTMLAVRCVQPVTLSKPGWLIARVILVATVRKGNHDDENRPDSNSYADCFCL